MEIFALINDSFYMLKKIIKTHTARLDYVDITEPTFLRNACHEPPKTGDR